MAIHTALGDTGKDFSKFSCYISAKNEAHSTPRCSRAPTRLPCIHQCSSTHTCRVTCPKPKTALFLLTCMCNTPALSIWAPRSFCTTQAQQSAIMWGILHYFLLHLAPFSTSKCEAGADLHPPLQELAPISHLRLDIS